MSLLCLWLCASENQDEDEGGEEGKVGFLPSPHSPSSFIFWLSFQILARPKPRLSLLRNQTETLATRAIYLGPNFEIPHNTTSPGAHTHAEKTVSLSNTNLTGQTSYTFHSTDLHR